MILIVSITEVVKINHYLPCTVSDARGKDAVWRTLDT